VETDRVSRIAPEVWTRLAGGRVRGETLWARRAAPDVSDVLLAAINADGRRHFLVRLEEGQDGLHDADSRGMGVMTRELEVPGHEAGRYLDITCHDAGGYEAFDLIGGEIAERLVGHHETPAESVARVVAKWRRFWGQPPRQMLSQEEQLGLFAELWFLTIWLAPLIGPAEALNRWRGAFGARHDFEWSGRSVEVKATTSARGPIHRIHGLEQLTPPDGGDLLLFSLQLFPEAGGTNTLPELVALCREQLAGHDEALSKFETALAQVGYSPAHEGEYGKTRMRVAREGLFAVREDFPRVTAEQFAAGIPAGVERVEYEINLNGFERFRVAESSGDPFPL